MEFNDLFWNADINDLKKGYFYDAVLDNYICLMCGESFENGVIYRDGDRFLEARKAAEMHIISKHKSVFDFLLNMDKRYTGLTENQKELMELFYEGYSDKEIVQHKGEGSTSTIRNQRFTFRERHKQAKIFLAIMELLEEGMSKKKEVSGEKLVEIHGGAKMVDERYAITEEEKNTVLKNYFDSNLQKLKVIPPKEKKKIIILQHIVSFFDKTSKYTEKELNAILKNINEDYATLRRYLIEYGFMDRTPNCSEYWVR